MRLLKCCAIGSVAAGAVFAVSATAKPVDFVTEVKPILEMNCLVCHNPKLGPENGKFRLDTKEEAFKVNKTDKRISPGHPEESAVYSLITLPLNNTNHMPKNKPVLAKPETEVIRQWITEGAVWPDGVTLKMVMKVEFVRDIEPILEHGGPISDKAKDTLRLWLSQGADWPASISFPSAKAAPDCRKVT